MISAFIADGYTEPFFLKAIDKVNPDVSGEFRPMTVTEQAEYKKAWDKLGKAEDTVGQRKLVAQWLVKNLISWDLTLPTGGLAPITVANVLQLKDPVFFRLFNIITLSEVSDDKPEGTKPTNLETDAGN